MIISTTVDNTLTNAIDSLNMGVIADGRMFKLLLNNLYSQPVAAILRELSCNAIDAHLSVGNLNPFHIQLPTLLNSNFVIRDFGPGLDEEEINLYLNTLFSSSKTQSNDFIGSFGLGSKVAFSLVSSFNIESYKNGIKYTCLWYEKECGTPTLIVTSREPTEEPNGLKFIVPLSDVDNKNNYPEQFLTTVKKNLFNLPIKPKFFYEIDNPETEYTIEYFCSLSKFYPEYNISIFNTFARYNSKFIHVNIGGIIYQSNVPLDYDFIKYILETHPYSQYDRILVVDVPIGELTLPMNREEIENTPQNIATIGKYYNTKIQDSILEDYFANLKEVIESDDFTYSALQEVLQLPSLQAYQLNKKIPPHILQLIKPLKVSDVDLYAISQSHRRDRLKTLSHFCVKLQYRELFNTLAENNLLSLNKIKLDYTRSSSRHANLFINNWDFKKLYIIYQDYSKEKPTNYSAPTIEKYFEQNNYNLNIDININNSNTHVAVYITFNNSLVLDYLKDFFSLINSQFNNETIFINYNTIPRVKSSKTPLTPKVPDSFVSNVKYVQYYIPNTTTASLPSLGKSILTSFKKSVLVDSNKVVQPFTLTNYFKYNSYNFNTIVLVDDSVITEHGEELSKLLEKDFELKKITQVRILVVVTNSKIKYQKMLDLLSLEQNIDTFYKIQTQQDFIDLRESINNAYFDAFLDFDNLKQVAHYYYLYFLNIYKNAFSTQDKNNFIILIKYLYNIYKYTDDSVIILTKEDDEIIRQNLEFLFDYFYELLNFKITGNRTNMRVIFAFVNNSSICLSNYQKIKNYNFKDNFIDKLLKYDILNYNVSLTAAISDGDPLVDIRDKFFKKFNFTK